MFFSTSVSSYRFSRYLKGFSWIDGISVPGTSSLNLLVSFPFLITQLLDFLGIKVILAILSSCFNKCLNMGWNWSNHPWMNPWCLVDGLLRPFILHNQVDFFFFHGLPLYHEVDGLETQTISNWSCSWCGLAHASDPMLLGSDGKGWSHRHWLGQDRQL